MFSFWREMEKNTRTKVLVSLFLLSLFLLDGLPPFLPGPLSAGLATKTQIPDFFAVTHWLNPETPVTRKSLEGNVVIITFWNFSCLRCIKQMTFLAAWQKKYAEKHFQVITLHTPHYRFEKFPENVEQAIKKLGFPFPVGLDPEGLMWQAYNRPPRPVYYMVDRRGRIRATSPENPDYAKEEAVLQDLLREQGEEITDEIDVKPKKNKEVTGEILFGFRDLSRYGNETKPRAEVPLNFQKPANLKTGFFYLSGKWSIGDETATALKKGCELAIPFQGARVFLIAGSLRDNISRAQIVIDGKALEKSILGRDTKIENGDGYLEFKDDGPYEVAKNLGGSSDRHLLEITFEDPDALLYAAEFD